MAIEYDLDIATPTPATHVADELVDAARAIGLFDTPVTAREVLDEGAVTRLGTWIRVYEPRLRPWNAVISDLGFTPRVSTGFRLNKDDKISEQQDDMIRLVSSLLDRVSGDLVLRSSFDNIWLLRRRGELSVSEQEDIWPPHRLATLTQPYHRATHTFSEE